MVVESFSHQPMQHLIFFLFQPRSIQILCQQLDFNAGNRFSLIINSGLDKIIASPPVVEQRAYKYLTCNLFKFDLLISDLFILCSINIMISGVTSFQTRSKISVRNSWLGTFWWNILYLVELQDIFPGSGGVLIC